MKTPRQYAVGDIDIVLVLVPFSVFVSDSTDVSVAVFTPIGTCSPLRTAA
jgi:hypothetical protein